MSKEKDKIRKEKQKRRPLYLTLIDQIKKDKKAFTVYLILHLLTLYTIIRSIFTGRFENLFAACLALLLLLLPSFIEKTVHITLPTTLEIFAYFFVFCAQILGEIGNYYQLFPFWDTMLHTFNGFLFAAFGFCLVDIFNQNNRIRFTLSPAFLSFGAFCFSMTIGVLWEFLEFGADMFLALDMQKDTFIHHFNTVSLPNSIGAEVTHVNNITESIIQTADGTIYTVKGYLDIGLIDTIKDLFVNFIGAIVFSVIGFFYVKQRGKGRFANQFIPTFEGTDAEKADAKQPLAEAKATNAETEEATEPPAEEGAEFPNEKIKKP